MRKQISLSVLLAIFSLLLPFNLTAEAVYIEVPYYVQGKDSEWADDKLGNKSSVTIRTHGCALTCISMVLSRMYEEEITPPAMNKWLKKNNGFLDAWEGNSYIGEVSLNWPALSQYKDGAVYTRFDWKARPADILLVKYYLDNAVPVIAEVVYRNAPHYIVLTGYDDAGFTMNDPEFPEEHRFERIYNISDKWGSGASRNINGIRVIYPDGYKQPVSR